MSGIEDIVRQVMASHDQEAPGAPDLLRALHTTLGHPSRRGKWPGLLVPLAAAAATVGVVAASLAISAAFQGHARPPGPGPAARSHPFPAALRSAASRPAALRQVPPYFAALTLTAPVQVMGGEAVVVRSTVTGHVLATVTPPRPYRIFTWVVPPTTTAPSSWPPSGTGPSAPARPGCPPRTGTSPPPRCSSG